MTTTELQLNGWEQIDTAFNDLRIRYVQQFANITADSTVLDIGCGTGMLLKALPSIKKVGIDLVDHTDYTQDITFLCGNFLDLTITETFDTVMCFSVLQHIDSDKLTTFVEKAICLATKNVCIFDVPHTFLSKDFFYQFSNSITIKDWDMPFCRYNHLRYNVNINL